MSQENDPSEVVDAIVRAEDAFAMRGFGRPTWEPGLDAAGEWQTQLTKACTLLDAIDALADHGAYYTAIVEISFGAIERSVEAYCLNLGDETIDQYDDHTEAYERAEALGLFDDVADDLTALYADNRTASYYGGRRPTEAQATAMAALATAIHEYVNDRLQNSGVCFC